jgi:hypothetical protein
MPHDADEISASNGLKHISCGARMQHDRNLRDAEQRCEKSGTIHGMVFHHCPLGFCERVLLAFFIKETGSLTRYLYIMNYCAAACNKVKNEIATFNRPANNR